MRKCARLLSLTLIWLIAACASDIGSDDRAPPTISADDLPPMPSVSADIDFYSDGDVECVATEDCIALQILYGSSRVIHHNWVIENEGRIGTTPRTPFTDELDNELNLGALIVTVPTARKSMKIQRPFRLRIGRHEIGQELNPGKHFVLRDYYELDTDQFGSVLRFSDDDILLFVHGFNVRFRDAAFNAAQIKVDSGFNGQAVIFSWPTFELPKYSESRSRAKASRKHLRKFLDIIQTNTKRGKVHIVAHSMGNYVLLDVLAEMADVAAAAGEEPYFGEVILAAPDVNAEEFERISRKLIGSSDGVTLYASSNDLAMKASREFCKVVAAVDDCTPRAGDVPSSGPVVVKGIDTIDVSALKETIFDLGFSKLGHSYHSNDRSIVEDIGRLLITGGTPNERNPALLKLEKAGLFYWKYR